MRPLIVGQAPGKNWKGEPPLSRGCGDRLARLCGLQHLTDAFDTANLLDQYPGKAGKGDAFPMAEAKVAAAWFDLSGRPFALLAGKGVARAFGLRPAYFEWQGNAAVVPHPSGINRWWNDPANVERARHFFTSLPIHARTRDI